MKLFAQHIYFTFLFFVLNVGIALAAVGDTPGGSYVQDSPGMGPGTSGGSSSSGGSGFLQNPLTTGSITGFFQSLLDVVMVFAIPVIVFFIILAGFKYVTARGDTYKIKDAHMALLYAVIGGVLILGASLILDVVTETISEF